MRVFFWPFSATYEREFRVTREKSDAPWWLRRRGELLALADNHASVFVYDKATMLQQAARLQQMPAIDRILFAMKSNFNPDLLVNLAQHGVDFECVSPQEVEHLQRAVLDLDVSRILFTPNFAPREDYEWARERGVMITLDNLYPLQAWPEVFAGSEIFVRIDPGLGRGHHDHVRTAGEHSKFGIPRFEVDELEKLVRRVGVEVVGIHAHSGSGIPEADTWGIVAEVLAEVADRFERVRGSRSRRRSGCPQPPGRSAFRPRGNERGVGGNSHPLAGLPAVARARAFSCW